MRSHGQLAPQPGLRVVAEGVETREISDALRAMGCDLAQGYSFSRALPAAEFAAWVTTERATVRSVGARSSRYAPEGGQRRVDVGRAAHPAAGGRGGLRPDDDDAWPEATR